MKIENLVDLSDCKDFENFRFEDETKKKKILKKAEQKKEETKVIEYEELKES